MADASRPHDSTPSPFRACSSPGGAAPVRVRDPDIERLAWSAMENATCLPSTDQAGGRTLHRRAPGLATTWRSGRTRSCRRQGCRRRWSRGWSIRPATIGNGASRVVDELALAAPLAIDDHQRIPIRRRGLPDDNATRRPRNHTVILRPSSSCGRWLRSPPVYTRRGPAFARPNPRRRRSTHRVTIRRSRG